MARVGLISLLCGAALVVAACGGSDTPEATPTATAASGAIPTATPFAALPTTTILDGGTGGVDTPAAEQTYVVVAGDSLSAIAERFGTTVEAIQGANGLTDTNIFVGQELTIPGGETSGGGAAASATPSASGNTEVYVVQAGDSGFGIALQFGVTLEELAAANGMSVDQLNNLVVGQELLIPSP